MGEQLLAGGLHDRGPAPEGDVLMVKHPIEGQVQHRSALQHEAGFAVLVHRGVRLPWGLLSHPEAKLRLGRDLSRGPPPLRLES